MTTNQKPAIYVMRHGRDIENHEDPNKCFAQWCYESFDLFAKEVAPQLNGTPLSIYSSPLHRAKKTAEAIAQRLPATIELSDDLYCDSHSIDRLVSRVRDSLKGPALLVSHQPDIGSYTGRSFSNCQYMLIR